MSPPDPAELAAARADPRRNLGKFLVLGELGRGGMGVVYRAWDERLGRQVALKLVLADAATPEAIARFEREAQALARVAHGGVLPVYEQGSLQGRPFLVTPLLDGGTLSDLVRRAGPAAVPLARRVELVRDVARAVHAAHEQGVVHRDLKPGNVLLDREGRPYVADFGLARLADGRAKLTATGAMLGTPAYAAPEQLGEGRADARSDVYGLAATLYFVLTGRPPFEGATELNVVSAVLQRPPEPPSRRTPGVPAPLEALCLAGLAKDPAARPATAAAFAQALDAWLAAPAARAPGHGPRGALAAVALACVALVALAALALRATPSAPSAAPPATAPSADGSEGADGASGPDRAPARSDVADRLRAAHLAACRGALRVRRVLGAPSGQLAAAPRVIAVAPDGRSALVGTCDLWYEAPGFVYRIDLPSLEVARGWRAHDRGVTGVALVSEHRAVTASRDGVIRLWDVAAPGRPLATVRAAQGAHNGVVSLAASGAGGRVLAAWGRTVESLVVRGDDLVRASDTVALPGDVAVALPLPHGRAFAIADKQAWLLELEAGKQVALPGAVPDMSPGRPVEDGKLRAAAVDPGGAWAAALGHRGTLRVWDLRTGAQVGMPPAPKAEWAIGWRPDRPALLVGVNGGLLPLEVAPPGVGSRIATTEVGSPTALAVTPGGEVLVGQHIGLALLPPGATALHEATAGLEAVRGIHALALSPDGGRLAVGTFEGHQASRVHVLDLVGDAAPVTIPTRGEYVRAVGFAAEGREVLALLTRGPAIVVRFDARTGAWLGQSAAEGGDHLSRLSAAAVAPDGAEVVTCSNGGSVSWRAIPGDAVSALDRPGPEAWVSGAALHPQEPLAAACFKGFLPIGERTRNAMGPLAVLWQLEGAPGARALEPTTYLRLDADPTGIAFLPGSADLVVTGASGVARWALTNEVPVVRYTDRPPREQASHAVAASSRHVAAAATDGWVEVFDADSGALAGALDLGALGDRAGAVLFAPDGGTLWVGTIRGLVLELEVGEAR